MTKTLLPLLSALLVAAATFAGCLGSVAETSAGPHVIEVVASDYAFSAPTDVPAGLAVLRLHNRGSEPHQATLFRVEGGKTFEDVLATFRAQGPGLDWLHAVGGPNAAMPGASATALAELEPGLHDWVCFIPDASGKPHFAHGMIAPLIVAPSAGSAPRPGSDMTMTLHDYGFGAPDTLAAGERTVPVRNDGPQPHEVALVRLKGDATAQDFLAAMAPGATAPPPGQFVGGLAELAAGEEAWFRADLEPGRYALICFIPDHESGDPHFQHGMTAELTVQ